jgi:hypothetical protein
MARILRSFGWRLIPPKSAVEDAREGGLPCPTCGAQHIPNASDHALRLAELGEVSAPILATATGGTLESARNVLSELARQGRLVRIGRGRYRAPEGEES